MTMLATSEVQKDAITLLDGELRMWFGAIRADGAMPDPNVEVLVYNAVESALAAQLEPIHDALDALHVPREHKGHELSLSARCEFLRAMIARIDTARIEATRNAAEMKTLWDDEVTAHRRSEDRRQEVLEHLAAARTLFEQSQESLRRGLQTLNAA